MRKILFALFSALILVGCFSMSNSPMTAFIVKNTSNQPISFKAGVAKQSVTFGLQIIENSFTVMPNDSVLS